MEAHPTKGVLGRLHQTGGAPLGTPPAKGVPDIWWYHLPRGWQMLGTTPPAPRACDCLRTVRSVVGWVHPKSRCSCARSRMWWVFLYRGQTPLTMPLRRILYPSQTPPRSLADPLVYGIIATPYLGGTNQSHKPGTNTFIQHYRTVTLPKARAPLLWSSVSVATLHHTHTQTHTHTHTQPPCHSPPQPAAALAHDQEAAAAAATDAGDRFLAVPSWSANVAACASATLSMRRAP